MKRLNVADLLSPQSPSTAVGLACWLRSRRHHGRVCFLELVDSSGLLEAVAEQGALPEEDWTRALSIPVESAVSVLGRMVKHRDGAPELRLLRCELIAEPKQLIYPPPRNTTDVFSEHLNDQTLRKRHIYIKSPQLTAVLQAKHALRNSLRVELDAEGFIELDLPIITMATLYEPESAFSLEFFGRSVYLSQCAGLYLAASTQSLERTYTVAPSFRATPSRSPRHNPEFWHIKGQMAFCRLAEMMDWLSEVIYRTVRRFAADAAGPLQSLGVTLHLAEFEPPYPSISYGEAVEIIRRHGRRFRAGKSFGPSEERLIASGFQKPVYVVGMPAAVEPFPYALDPKDPTSTVTADLLAPGGFGEILGVAEFEHDPERVRERMAGFSSARKESLAWYLEVLEHAAVPFSGFGLGLERTLRWLLGLPHVKHTFAFPRLYRRAPYP